MGSFFNCKDALEQEHMNKYMEMGMLRCSRNSKFHDLAGVYVLGKILKISKWWLSPDYYQEEGRTFNIIRFIFIYLVLGSHWNIWSPKKFFPLHFTNIYWKNHCIEDSIKFFGRWEGSQNRQNVSFSIRRSYLHRKVSLFHWQPQYKKHDKKSHKRNTKVPGWKNQKKFFEGWHLR